MTQPHVFTVPGQKATRYKVGRDIVDKPFWVRINPRTQLFCFSCDRRRWAKNMRVHVYYDCTRFFCQPACPKGRARRRRLPRRRLPLPVSPRAIPTGKEDKEKR